jgi:GntR family transcriptional regulator/MocR family aminotransferase
VPWTPALALRADPADRRPLFERVGGAVAEAIRSGRLRPGDRLPSTRALAASLGVHRNTVIAAYAELAAQGWTRSARGRGTFVSEALPDVPARPFAEGPVRRPTRLGFSLPRARTAAPPLAWPPPTDVLSLAGGVPDLREAPAEELARAYRRALLRRRGPSALDYGYERGHPALRAQLAAMLSALRGLSVGPDEVFVTRGSQLALYLTARAIIRPGDVVAVERLGYAPAWEAFRAAGARLVPVSLDESGMHIEPIAALARGGRLRAVYLTPHHQYPTLAVLAPERRLELLALARRHRFAIVEDDYDYEMHYEGRPLLPLASADDAGVVVYVGTLSKILAPGVRIGYVVAPAPLLERFAWLRRAIDRQGDPAIERAVAELLEDGVVERHAKRVRRVYRARRDALGQALRGELGDVVSFALPPGGMALWVKTAAGLDVDAWARRSLARGAHFLPGRAFAFDGRPRAAARLGYACLDEAELEEAVRRMRAAL